MLINNDDKNDDDNDFNDNDDMISESVVVSTSSGQARVTELDILTRDGVIHAIDTVI